MVAQSRKVMDGAGLFQSDGKQPIHPVRVPQAADHQRRTYRARTGSGF